MSHAITARIAIKAIAQSGGITIATIGTLRNLFGAFMREDGGVQSGMIFSIAYGEDVPPQTIRRHDGHI